MFSIDISPPADTFDIEQSSSRAAAESETAGKREAAGSVVSLQPADSSTCLAGEMSDEEDFEFINSEDL